MHNIPGRRFDFIFRMIAEFLLTMGDPVTDSHRWQGQDVSGNQSMVPIELQNVNFEMNMAENIGGAQKFIQPNLPWAEDHFLERVGGKPLNPPPSAKTWPFAQAGHAEHTNELGQFSHTYPERFWPAHAAHPMSLCNVAERGLPEAEFCDYSPRFGIRYYYGDLNDVARMLHEDPATRQAYLPIWFPEDTGATMGQRVPCSLGYHFMIRRGRLNVTYMIRAVDFMRHFRDDVYMAVRLGQWMTQCANVPDLRIGTLTMHVMSLHCFAGDMRALEAIAARGTKEQSEALLEAMA